MGKKIISFHQLYDEKAQGPFWNFLISITTFSIFLSTVNIKHNRKMQTMVFYHHSTSGETLHVNFPEIWVYSKKPQIFAQQIEIKKKCISKPLSTQTRSDIIHLKHGLGKRLPKFIYQKAKLLDWLCQQQQYFDELWIRAKIGFRQLLKCS